MTTGTPESPNPYAVELALAAALRQVTDAQDAAITQAWARAWSEVSQDLFDALLDILAETGRVNAAAVVRYERLATVLAAIADQLEDLAEQLGITITNDLAEVLAMAGTGTHQLIAAQLTADRATGLRKPPPAALTAIVRRTTEQVTSTALPLADETYAVILRELTRGVAAGDNPRETAARMVQRAENLHNFGLSRALTIARTETLDAYREGQRATEDANADVLAGWVWLAHLGPRTCRSCLAMHGEVFGLEVRGPDDHQQGRCSRCPVVREEDGSVDLSWLPDAEEHFERLPVEDQRAILGRKGYDAWAAGDFPRELWVKRQRNDGWRDSYVPASPGDGGAGGGTPPGGIAGGGGDEPPVEIATKLDIVDEELRPTVEAAAEAIGAVHRVPAGMKIVEVREMPAEAQQQRPGLVGGYFQGPGDQDRPTLWLRPPYTDKRVETVIHELGHAIDDLVFGQGNSNILNGTRTKLDTVFADWWSTVQSSQTYRVLGEMAAWDAERDGPWWRGVSATTGEQRDFTPRDETLAYLMRPTEVFGRAYSQWIATRTQRPELLVRLEYFLMLARNDPEWIEFPLGRVPFYPYQWEPEDFEPIAEALERLFQAQGLMTPEATS